MYISIDMTTLNLICKHPNFMCCWNYSLISVADSFNVFPADNAIIWDSFTDLELQMLYINLTGNTNGCIKPRDFIVLTLIQYIMESEETLIDAEQVRKQVDYCEQHNALGQMVYVHGANRPTFAEETVWMSLMYNEQLELQCPIEQNFKQPYQVEYEHKVQHIEKTSVEVKMPKKGVCARIWEIADYLWETHDQHEREAFTDRALKQVKVYARQTLLSEGINPSTISVQLNKWQKTKHC